MNIYNDISDIVDKSIPFDYQWEDFDVENFISVKKENSWVFILSVFNELIRLQTSQTVSSGSFDVAESVCLKVKKIEDNDPRFQDLKVLASFINNTLKPQYMGRAYNYFSKTSDNSLYKDYPILFFR